MDDAAFAALDRFIEGRMAADNTPGLALALTDRERTLRVATYGFADLAARTPVTPDALFEIGSIGKTFTSLALMREHEAGNLDLRAPVSQYIPWFEVRSAFPPITVHDLLTHTAGIIAGTDPTPSVEYQVWAMRETETASAPGTRFHYSNLGYKVLGLLLSRITGQDYGTAIQERVLAPLGMDATEPTITNAMRSRRAVGHAPRDDDRPFHPRQPLVPATWLETDSGDGCLASTPEDMATFLRLYLNRGQGPRGRLLSETGYATMTQRAIAMEEGDDPLCYGYGLMINQTDGHTYLGHSGGMIGFFAFFLTDLDAGFGAVALINGPGRPYSIARQALAFLRATLHGEALPDLPAIEDPSSTEDAASYAGIYRGEAGTFEVAAAGDRLVLHRAADRVVLEPYFDDFFFVPDPAYDRFLLSFGRDADGEVVELFHGADWYVNDRYQGPTTFDTPPQWGAYQGRYISFNPWAPTFRVVQRKGQLWLIFPSAPDGFEDEQPLVPLDDGSFRAGTDEANPERIRFDTIIEGKALRAHLSDGAYERSSAP